MSAVVQGTARALAASTDWLVRRPGPGDGPLDWRLRVMTARALRRLDRATDDRIDVSRAGRALLAARPDALHRLGSTLTAGSVLVTGTNGKTTTTKLLVAMLRASGCSPVTNRAGANMPGGLTAELVAASGAPRGRAADLGVFEVDELWLGEVVDRLDPSTLVLLNLSRDQLDRLGEVDVVEARWRAIIDAHPETHLVLNADDPRVRGLADGRRGVTWFGVEAGSSSAGPGVFATRVQDHGLEGTSCVVETPSGSVPLALRLAGRFNVANAVAAMAAASAFGDAAEAARAAAGVTAAFGRGEHIAVGAGGFHLFLVKNPAGLDAVLDTVEQSPAPVDLVFALNDGELDGRDVSWIWDADLERLAGLLASIRCTGTRAADAAMRMKYAGLAEPGISLVDAPSEAVMGTVGRPDRTTVVLANYTAMLDLREWLAEQGHVPRYWR